VQFAGVGLSIVGLLCGIAVMAHAQYDDRDKEATASLEVGGDGEGIDDEEERRKRELGRQARVAIYAQRPHVQVRHTLFPAREDGLNPPGVGGHDEG
jgi:hypothetical protein